MKHPLITEDYCVVSPAYGRDYKNAKDAKVAFLSGEDWVFECCMDVLSDKSLARGTYCSKRDFKPGLTVEVRYHKLQKLVMVRIPDSDIEAESAAKEDLRSKEELEYERMCQQADARQEVENDDLADPSR